MRLHGGSPKKPARLDPRTIKLAALFHKKLPAPPADYVFDTDVRYNAPGIPTPMFLNDRFGDCVIASRAHVTLRFERREQGIILPIADKEVEWEWKNENGGTLEGLEMLSSLKAWRKWGWTAAQRNYKLHAFAQVDPCQTDHVQLALANVGPMLGGFDLPFDVTKDTSTSRVWDLVKGSDATPDPDGGHCMAVIGYAAHGVLLVTWGRLQWVTWAWFEAYCSELYGLVDAINAGVTHPVIDPQQLEAELAMVAA